MLTYGEVLSTLEMLKNEHLDVRTVTLGISLFDCASDDPSRFIDRMTAKIGSCRPKPGAGMRRSRDPLWNSDCEQADRGKSDCGRRVPLCSGPDGRGCQGDGPRRKKRRSGFYRRVQRPCREGFYQRGPRPDRGHSGGACGNGARLLLGKSGVHPRGHQYGRGLPHGKDDKEGPRN